MTNYGALAILALPKMPYRQFRLLVALETVTPDGSGQRSISTTLLASKAGLSPSTTRRVRNELADAGLILYKPGSGRGKFSTYRLLFDIKGDHGTEHLSGAKGAQTGPERCSNHAPKGAHQNPVTSTNANTGLSTSGLETSGLPPRGPASLNGQPRGKSRQQRETDEQFERSMQRAQEQDRLEDPPPMADTIAQLRAARGWQS